MNKRYGKSVAIDLCNCRQASGRGVITKYLKRLCDLIDMEREDLHFWDYDGDPEGYAQAPAHLKGTSAVQFIKTSSIVIHVLDDTGQVFIDLFSCKDFNSETVAEFSAGYSWGMCVTIRHSSAGETIALMMVPTGIGAAIGGDAGDATPAAKLLAQVCDRLIIHPNIVNASDINEMTPNMVYVDGMMMDRLLTGRWGLKFPKRANRIAVLYNDPLTNITVNAVQAARHTIGGQYEMYQLTKPLRMIAENQDGRATGRLEGIESAEQDIKRLILSHHIDAVAIHTPIECDEFVAAQYFERGGINPWGGVEALASREISVGIGSQVCVAHAPLDAVEKHNITMLDKLHLEPVPGRAAAEALSAAYLHCVLKGLQWAPKIVPLQGADLTLQDISVIVMPDGVEHATVDSISPEWKIDVLRVADNRTIYSDSSSRASNCRNYLEAAARIACIKAGIDPRRVLR